MGRTRRREARPGLLPTQREVVRDLMLTSSKYSLWLTLKQLARLTGYGEASISAQLRHLRKRQYGGFILKKRCRNQGQIGSGGDPGPVWEYKLSRRWRAPSLQHSSRRQKVQVGRATRRGMR